MKIEERVETWIGEVTLRPKTLERYMYSLKGLVRFGLGTVEEIDRERLKLFLGERRAKGITAQTCNRDLAAVLSFTGWLESRGEFPLERLLAMRRLRLATPPPPSPRYLTRPEYLALRDASESFRHQLGIAVRIAVHAGLRFGELRTLYHEDLELEGDRPFVRVRRSLGRETKTMVERTPPIARAFAEELRELGLPRSGPIFRRTRRSLSPYLAQDTLQRWLLDVRRKIDMEDVSFITCRHTYASWLVQAGVSIAKVARWMGHGVNVCFRHYAGLAPGGDPDVERGFAVEI